MRMKYSLQRAKRDLSKLVKLACAGEEVVIVRGGLALAKLVPIVRAIKNRVPGRLKGEDIVDAGCVRSTHRSRAVRPGL
jgi:antitoxin (DNA-binding transcriptional repressor) of toxin-antitoxin stability system